MKMSSKIIRSLLLAALMILPANDVLAQGKPPARTVPRQSSGGTGGTIKISPTFTKPSGNSFSGVSKTVKPLDLKFSQGSNGIRTVGEVGKPAGIGKVEAIKPINTRPKLGISANEPKGTGKPTLGRVDGPIKTKPGLIDSGKQNGNIKTMPFVPGLVDQKFGQGKIKTMPYIPGLVNFGKNNKCFVGSMFCSPHHFCGYFPKHCWWWYGYCYHYNFCQPFCYYPCNWNYVTCNYLYAGTVIQNVRFYLGVQGMLLPGKGLGIEAVEAGSPADLVGLKPGMVIVSANGIALTTEQSLTSAMAQSNGVLQLQVTNEAGQASAVNVQLQRVVVSSY